MRDRWIDALRIEEDKKKRWVAFRLGTRRQPYLLTGLQLTDPVRDA